MFDQWIKTNRNELNLSQERLGELVGCSQQSIQKYERGLCRPSLEVVSDMASLFNSEVHITPNGIETTSLNPHREPFFVPISGDDYLRTSRFIDQRLTELVDDYPKADVYFIFKNHRCSLETLHAILEDRQLCEAISEELSFRTFKTIMAFEDSTEMFDPHQTVAYGDYQMEIVSEMGDCQSSLNLSLFSSDKETDSRREWFWCLYSEIDGTVDHLQRMMSVNEYSTQDVLVGLVEMAELFITLPEFKALLIKSV